MEPLPLRGALLGATEGRLKAGQLRGSERHDHTHAQLTTHNSPALLAPISMPQPAPLLPSQNATQKSSRQSRREGSKGKMCPLTMTDDCAAHSANHVTTMSSFRIALAPSEAVASGKVLHFIRHGQGESCGGVPVWSVFVAWRCRAVWRVWAVWCALHGLKRSVTVGGSCLGGPRPGGGRRSPPTVCAACVDAGTEHYQLFLSVLAVFPLFVGGGSCRAG